MKQTIYYQEDNCLNFTFGREKFFMFYFEINHFRFCTGMCMTLIHTQYFKRFEKGKETSSGGCYKTEMFYNSLCLCMENIFGVS